uniref:Uncharacterized protein n=1 Tax=Romanomermis culicivorax TaxID=13658 RepID=A0A915ID11_ROMCU
MIYPRKPFTESTAAYIIYYMPPYYTEMMPTFKKKVAEYRRIYLRVQLRRDP